MGFESASLAGEGLIQKSADNYTYSYFLKDHLGSTRMVLDEDGSIKEALMYQPYGTVSDVDGISAPMPDPLREKFTGKEFDEDGDGNGASGIQAYHFGFRVYDPEVGVWNRPDPMDQHWNSYSYVGGNPVNLIDPWGLKGTETFDPTDVTIPVEPTTTDIDIKIADLQLEQWGENKSKNDPEGGGAGDNGGTNVQVKTEAELRAERVAEATSKIRSAGTNGTGSGIVWSVKSNFSAPENFTLKLTAGAGFGGNVAVIFANNEMYLNFGYGWVGGVSFRAQTGSGTPTQGLSLNVKASAAVAGGGGELSATTKISNGNVSTVIKPAGGFGFGASVGITGNVTIKVRDPKAPWSAFNEPQIGTGEAFMKWYGLD